MDHLFIANRGEIAVRIIRTAQQLGIRTTLAVSEADTDSLAAQMADDTALVGPAPATASYLNGEAVLKAARDSGADALHPGFGFLSENADFAQMVSDAGIIWVGPDPESIRLMGNKAAARAAAVDAGVPTLAGSDGALAADADVTAIAAEIGYPLVVKASAGGGGRGIRRVESAEQLPATIDIARAEAAAAFGDDALYMERFVDRARHVEVQVLGDGERYIHLGDRDCSMQRRQQKVIEEAEAPSLPDHVRDLIRSSSVELARRSGYKGAGTVEFLYDPARETAAFIEMNTRLQVEHPVTEFVTGIDIVAEQLRIAEGRGLSVTQDEVAFDGHAIEVRINAEDPAHNFMPSPGTITALRWPDGEGVRIDSGFVEGGVVAPFYDSMLAKLIVHAPDRDQAIAKMERALDDTEIDGVKTTVPLLRALIAREEFAAVDHYSTFVESADILLEKL
ncbi:MULTISPECIES: acetyl/propionyl/methylcrotonyl-CoA carboxylase subunit alpha [Brevibacterium]|uniref:biotin carboxylase n=1 Tax=Brevibacterium casei TaxID=33889 RepID=A0A7T4DJ49_9MICO|nr:acetyl-CoA carboxylase biotin carboxylase subunit [Brevibacterium casei]QQB15247.1 acetyl-CoA carboxylase biotin carboxylase subunit [Brevibacterium casei]